MRKFFISAAIVSAAAVAAPATANFQDYGRYSQSHYRGGESFRPQFDQLVSRIRDAESRRLINRREADRLLRQVQQLDRLASRYARNGIDRREHQDLQSRLQDLRNRVRSEIREGRDDRRDRRW